MNDLDRMKQIAGIAEDEVNTESSSVEQAMRIIEGIKTQFDAILDKTDDVDLINIAADGWGDCKEALKALRNIK